MEPDFRLMAAYTRLARWYDAMYEAMEMRNFSFNAQLADSLSGFCAEREAWTVLDCACGTGDPMLGMKLCQPRLELTGTDANSAMLQLCMLKALELGISVAPLSAAGGSSERTIQIGRVSWQQLPETFEARFDLVMCRGHAIYHLVERDRIVEAIEWMAMAARPGGYVMLDSLVWTADLRGEEGRGDVKFRGWLAADHPSNPAGVRVMFVDTLKYREDERAVRGIIQTKTLVVLGEFPEGVRVIDELSVEGATFTTADLMGMATDAGLGEVAEISLAGQRYPAVVGRR